MGRLRVTPPGKVKHNFPITKVGKKQYLKRRFSHDRKVEKAGSRNPFTKEFVKKCKTITQNYARLGFTTDPCLPTRVLKNRLKDVRSGLQKKIPVPLAPKASFGRPINEQEGSTIANLLKVHGTDLKRMQFDSRLNPYQWTPRQLQRRILNYLRYERAAFPKLYAEALQKGWPLEDFSNKNLRYGKNMALVDQTQEHDTE